ncbi:MAG: 3-hydroxyacyl-ACP dehydratase FabZ [Myxococcaceae bacterium]|nr:3-hydroxyacyl-ACP dehydratase FabZ [Myxococcaceae bacterium]
MNVQDIQALLPHRYPFLLVDRVTALVPQERLVARKMVTANEPFFQGHFPGHMVMPGVLILEAMAQASAVLAYKSEGKDPKSFVTYLMSIDGAKFRRPVVPGDCLELTIEVLRHKTSVWKTRGTATVDGQLAAEAEFLATVAPVGKV